MVPSINNVSYWMDNDFTYFFFLFLFWSHCLKVWRENVMYFMITKWFESNSMITKVDKRIEHSNVYQRYQYRKLSTIIMRFIFLAWFSNHYYAWIKWVYLEITGNKGIFLFNSRCIRSEFEHRWGLLSALEDALDNNWDISIV